MKRFLWNGPPLHRTVTLLLLAGTLAGCDDSERDRLQSENDELSSEVEALERALAEANEQILEAASAISEAKSNLYLTCEELRTAVESMDEPDEIGRP